MMAHNIMIFLYEIFDVRNTDSFASYNFVIWNIHLKRFVPHPNVSEFHLLNYLTPPPLYSSLQIHQRDHWSKDSWKTTVMNYFVELDFIIIFMVLNIVLENYFEDVFIFGGLELCRL